MSENNFFFDQIEQEAGPFPWEKASEQHSYLDIEDFFNQPNPTRSQKSCEDEFESELKVEPSKTKRINKGVKKDKNPPESSYTKNVCFNICQKTIKVISNGEYQDKLEQICSEFNQNAADFENDIIKRKKDFTGPKALKYFVDEETTQSKIFSKFMKWFLENKYLRHALKSGEMKSIEAYITYKNQVLLNILN